MKSKGFTLIELIIVIAILGIILGVSFNMMLFGINAHEMTVSEYKLQSSMRIASERTNDIVKYSSSLFTIPEGSFRKDNLDKEWDYFGVSEDSKQIIYYKANPSKVSLVDPKFHDEVVVVDSQDNVEYDFVFKKNDDLTSSNLLEFVIEGHTSDNKSEKIAINTELSAINAGFVKDYGTNVNLANAIAYRSDRLVSAIPKKNKIGTITMVLDVSGSMGNKLGGSTSDKDNKKIDLLTASAKKIVDGFAKEKDLELILSIVPFSTSANYTNPTSSSSNQNHPFYNLAVQSEVDSLKSKIGNLTANGGTNTGDGLRRGYYNTVTKNNTLITVDKKEPKNYLIVLVDGVSTYASVTNGGYFINDGYLSNLTKRSDGVFNAIGVMGKGSSLDTYATEYVNLMGKKSVDAKLYDKVYVIGFSSVTKELESVNDIAKALGIKNPESSEYVFKFTNMDFTLDGVFDAIKEDIIQQLWRVEGPKF